MSNPSPAPRKSVSCSNPWCSDRALCVHCKADHAPKGEADFTLKASDTQRGFHRIDFKDRYGNACSLQDSSLATEACVWFGDNRERAHLTAPMVAALLPHLAAFVECGSIRNPTAENEQHPVSASDTAAADGVTMAQCPDCAAVHDARRVVQSDPSNQTPEWRAVTMALSGYRMTGNLLTNNAAKGSLFLSTPDIIGIAKAVLGRMPETSWGGLKLLDQAAIQFRKYEAHHRAKNTDESLAKAEVNAEIAGRIESYVDAEARRDSGARGPAATLGNLLAVIHGDGGHRQAEVGTVEAAREAEEIVTTMRAKTEAIIAAARADAFDDAAAIVARQYKIGGLNLTTMESCMQASWMFSNEAYRIREVAGLPNPGAAEYMPAAEERLRRAILGDSAVIPEGHVKMPTSEAEAKAMVAVGEAFLKGRAEEAARS